MRAGLSLLFLALLFASVACNSVERDIRLATIGDDLKDIAYGGDRGIWNYRAEIHESVTAPSGRYFYRTPAHVSHYRIDRAVHGLGGTKIDTAEQLAQGVDVLLWVATNDPTPLVRSSAVYQLGRILIRMPVPRNDTIPANVDAEERIHALVQDLFQQKLLLDRGGQVKIKDVIQLMGLLSKLWPPRIHTAVEMVRAFSLPPIALAAPGPVRETRELMVPPMVRDAILVVLREIACGNPTTGSEPDKSALVRARAARVLTRTRSAAAREQAAARLADEFDPKERDPIVRGELLRYLGAVGNRVAFQACYVRLGDTDPSTRYLAQAALQRMTGAAQPRTMQQWDAYRSKRKRWRKAAPPTKPKTGTNARPAKG